MNKCPNGAILPKTNTCPLENGCPKDKPLKCGKFIKE